MSNELTKTIKALIISLIVIIIIVGGTYGGMSYVKHKEIENKKFILTQQKLVSQKLEIEKQKKEQLQNLKHSLEKRLQKNFYISNDEINNITVYIPKNILNYHRTDKSGCCLIIGMENNTPKLILYCINYDNNNKNGHFDQVMFRISDIVYTIKHNRFKLMDYGRNSNHDTYTYTEFPIYGENLEAINALVKSKNELKFRFYSTTYETSNDITLTFTDIEWLKETWDIWNILKNNNIQLDITTMEKF